MSVPASVASAARWWRDALAASVPLSVCHVWYRDPVQYRIIALAEPVLQAGRATVSITPEAIQSLGRPWRRFVSSVVIEVPAERCFVRDVEIPTAAVHRARDVLVLDMEATTPFRRSDVYTGFQRIPADSFGDRVQFRQVILKRSVLSEIVGPLDRAKIAISRIVVTGLSGGETIDLLDASARQHSSAIRWVRGLAISLCAAAVLTVTAGLGAHVYNLHRTSAETTARLATASRASQAVRKQLADADAVADQVRLVRQRKAETVSTVALWEEITRVLPATAWLTDFRIESGQGQIDGLSQNAPELIRLLTSSPLLSDVTFASPVTRDPQHGVERFQIKFKVRALNAKVVDAKAARKSP